MYRAICRLAATDAGTLGLLSAGIPSISIALADRIAASVPAISASRDATWCAKRKWSWLESRHGSRRSRRRRRTSRSPSGGINPPWARTMTLTRASEPESSGRQPGHPEHERRDRDSLRHDARLSQLASDWTHPATVPAGTGAIAASAASTGTVASRILYSPHPLLVP